MDDVARGKPGIVRIDGVLRNDKGDISFMFSKDVSIRDSNKAEVFAILEVMPIFSASFQGSLIVENHSSNVISWVSHDES